MTPEEIDKNLNLMAKNQEHFVMFAENTTKRIIKLAEMINFVFKLSLVSTAAFVLVFIKVYLL
jgi:hypothetical protein